MSHLITNWCSQFGINLVCNSACQGNGCKSSRLCDCYFSKLVVILFDQELSYLSTLTRAGFSANERDQMIVDCFNYFLFLHVDRKFLSELDDLFCSLNCIVSCRDVYIGMSDIFHAIWFILVIRKFYFFLIFNDF